MIKELKVEKWNRQRRERIEVGSGGESKNETKDSMKEIAKRRKVRRNKENIIKEIHESNKSRIILEKEDRNQAIYYLST